MGEVRTSGLVAQHSRRIEYESNGSSVSFIDIPIWTDVVRMESTRRDSSGNSTVPLKVQPVSNLSVAPISLIPIAKFGGLHQKFWTHIPLIRLVDGTKPQKIVKNTFTCPC